MTTNRTDVLCENGEWVCSFLWVETEGKSVARKDTSQQLVSQ